MKVCFIAGTLGRGGAERQLLFMLRALKSRGIQSRVLCLTKGEAYENEIKSMGIEVEWMGSSENRIMRLVKIIDNIRQRPVDIVQSAHFYTNIYTAVTGRLLGIPSIGAIRNDLFSEIVSNGRLGSLQLKFPEHLIANSEMALTRASGLGIKTEDIHLVRNVVELQNKKAEPPKESTTILFAGRLVRQKDPELFLRLAFRLIQDLPKLKLKFQIAGDGPLRKELEHSVFTSGVSGEQICFLGERPDMGEVYRGTDILVLTSEHEGTPNVILEAMTHGIPVVATQVGGVPEILTEDFGFLVDPSDFHGLVLATTKLIKQSRLRRRFGKNGRKHVSDNHSLSTLGKRLNNIYSKLVEHDQLDG